MNEDVIAANIAIEDIRRPKEIAPHNRTHYKKEMAAYSLLNLIRSMRVFNDMTRVIVASNFY